MQRSHPRSQSWHRLAAALVAAAICLSSAAAQPAGAAGEAVTAFSAEQVRAAFAKGASLVETARYKIHASRREAPGEAEIHERDTDLIYVLEGTATFVTGGRAVGARETAPGELRGSAIEGGDARELAPGQVVVVPKGTPHWFQQVTGPFVYYVVKVTEGGGEAVMRGPLLAVATYYVLAALLAVGAARAADAAPPALPPVPEGAPSAVIDLGSASGAAQVGATWRHVDAQIVEIPHRAPDAQGQPTGAPIRTHGIAPDAGWRDFDDSSWEELAPEQLSTRVGGGRLDFHWYRLRLRIPERVGAFETRGSTLVFETVLDDYAEIWIDGELARALGQRGGSVVGGWNAPNRVVIARDAQPGREIQLAVFGINGPLSDPPANFIWIRSAKLEFHPTPEALRGPFALPPSEVNLRIERVDPRLDAIVPASPKLFKLAEGFQFLEGPVWVRAAGAAQGGSRGRGTAAAGHLLFSDPNANRIYRYDPVDGGRLSLFREHSGYDGADIAEYRQPGSNGLFLDPQGRLTIAEHGRRRISRLGADGEPEVLADRFEGQRLNSPNDLVWRKDGTLYFSDPPFGLPRAYDDPRKELDFSGVFAWRDGSLRLVSRELIGPNGLALSPDERWLYVANWDPAKKVVMRHAVNADGSLGSGRVFFDLTAAPGEEALDGIEVDRAGNLYVSGPGGLWILSPGGEQLGSLRAPQLAANLEWGDDGHSLYLTARSALYRLPLLSEGPSR